MVERLWLRSHAEPLLCLSHSRYSARVAKCVWWNTIETSCTIETSLTSPGNSLFLHQIQTSADFTPPFHRSFSQTGRSIWGFLGPPLMKLWILVEFVREVAGGRFREPCWGVLARLTGERRGSSSCSFLLPADGSVSSNTGLSSLYCKSCKAGRC